MALVVEDGTGLSTAESYISVANAGTRRTNLGDNTAWDALTTAQKEQALRKGAQYIEERYAQRWKGERLVSTQALSWPRWGAIVHGWDVLSTIVPAAVANANADLALKSLTETLNVDLARGIAEKQIGPLKTVYDPYSPQSKRYPAIDGMLAPYLTGGGASARLIRA